MCALRYEAARIDVEAQEPALDRAVPQGVCASRMKSERVAELRVAGEDRGLPTDELLAQTRAKLGIQRLQLRCGSKALAIRRIRAQQSLLLVTPVRVSEIAPLDMNRAAQVGTLRVLDRHPHRAGVVIEAAKWRSWPTGTGAFFGFGTNCAP